jgi:MCP family monocarboxylic acid transporter-like MFS transporter 10
MRILALITFAVLTAANMTLRPRLPPKNLPGGFLNFKVFKSPVFSVYCASLFINFFGNIHRYGFIVAILFPE